MKKSELERNQRIIKEVGFEKVQLGMIGVRVSLMREKGVRAVQLKGREGLIKMGWRIEHDGVDQMKLINKIIKGFVDELDIDITGYNIHTVGNIELEFNIIRLER